MITRTLTSNVEHNKKHLSIGYRKVQLMILSFDEFQVVLYIHPVDILTVLKHDLQATNVYSDTLKYLFMNLLQGQK